MIVLSLWKINEVFRVKSTNGGSEDAVKIKLRIDGWWVEKRPVFIILNGIRFKFLNYYLTI